MFRIVKHYRDDDMLRRSFNALAQKSFGISFELWYQSGFWGERYDPYSIVEDGRVVANVSVNRMDMRICGKERKLIQLGTVMTDEAYRNRGLIRVIMEEIQREFADTDGMFLFANDSVLDFYPKFGFRRGTEHQYEKAVAQEGSCRMEQVPMDTPARWQQLRKAMEENAFRGSCDMLDNPGLMFFYIFDYLSDCVFYSKELNVWCIAQREQETLRLLNVFSKNAVSLESVINAFGSGVKKVILGFAPEAVQGWEKRILHEQDSTFFVKGDIFREFEERHLRIPVLAKA